MLIIPHQSYPFNIVLCFLCCIFTNYVHLYTIQLFLIAKNYSITSLTDIPHGGILYLYPLWVLCKKEGIFMKLMNKLEHLLDWGGMRRDVIFLIISGLSLLASIFDLFPLPLMRHGSPLFSVAFRLSWKLSSDLSLPLISRQMFWYHLP